AGEDITRIMEQGRKAWQFTRGLVEDKKVRLELDQERYDKYGRLLAYVYLDNGACLNFEIVKAGFAEPLAIAPNLRYADTFEQLYGEARRQKKGLWQ
ncbi:MAG: thermonuclease family protein, partial [Candidatus Omnitrophota bacterium]